MGGEFFLEPFDFADPLVLFRADEEDEKFLVVVWPPVFTWPLVVVGPRAVDGDGTFLVLFLLSVLVPFLWSVLVLFLWSVLVPEWSVLVLFLWSVLVAEWSVLVLLVWSVLVPFLWSVLVPFFRSVLVPEWFGLACSVRNSLSHSFLTVSSSLLPAVECTPKHLWFSHYNDIHIPKWPFTNGTYRSSEKQLSLFKAQQNEHLDHFKRSHRVHCTLCL